MSKHKAPKGLSAGARRRWREQIDALELVARDSPARLELVSSWARAIDAAGHARAVWQEAGSPESEVGSMGQERRHHLAVALEKTMRWSRCWGRRWRGQLQGGRRGCRRSDWCAGDRAARLVRRGPGSRGSC